MIVPSPRQAKVHFDPCFAGGRWNVGIGVLRVRRLKDTRTNATPVAHAQLRQDPIEKVFDMLVGRAPEAREYVGVCALQWLGD